MLHVNSVFFDVLRTRETILNSLPNGHEREAKEKTEGSSKLSKPGLKRINQGLLLDKGVLGNRPETEGH